MERNEAIEILSQRKNCMEYVTDNDDEAFDMAIDSLKTGYWIHDTSLGYHVSICSNCNWRGHGNEILIYRPKYCPNCGSRNEVLKDGNEQR